MRIGIDISRAAPTRRTGTERYSYELLAALARSDRCHEYTLYCNGLPAELPPLGTNFSLRNIPLPRLWTHARLGPASCRDRLDLLFIPAHVLPLLHPPRSVVTIHDLGYLRFPAAYTARRRLELHLTTLWSARAAGHLIADSAATRDDLAGKYAINPDKISVVYLACGKEFQPSHDPAVIRACRLKYGILPLEKPYLLYVGTLQPRKNLRRLIDAFAQTAAGEVLLVLAGGRGWLSEPIAQRAAALAGQVHCTGFVADEDLPVLLSGAQAFVFPSLHEGFGMPVLEAMACGTPVLTSRCSSLPEVAGEAALLVDPLDTAAIAAGLRCLLDAPELRAELRERGLAQAARFSWERCARETRQVLLRAATENFLCTPG
jgi:glycosyltransferase involved in cell wall biosynthesis